MEHLINNGIFKMKKLTLISSSILLSLTSLSISTLAQANTFQQEAELGYMHTDNIDILMAGFTHHFEQQSVNKGPWAEAAFLNKSSFIGGALTYLDANDSDTAYSVFGQGMLNETYYLNGLYTTTDNVNVFGIGGGAYLTPNSAIYLNYQNNDIDNGDSTYNLTLGYKLIANLSNNNFINFNAEISDDDGEFNSYSANADYYFSPKTYLGLGVAYNDYDEYGSHTDFEVSAGHFFNNQVGVDLSYVNGDDDNLTTVSAVFRF